MKTAIVVGSGAGGATVAKELQGTYAVTVLEAGKAFKPFSIDLGLVERFKRTGLLFDEREIELLFPAMRIRKTRDGMVLVNGVGLGGTTTLCAGNALRVDSDLREIGIDLDPEFDELYREVPVTTDHQRQWRPTTHRLYSICQDMNLNPKPTPKMGDYQRCVGCGRCVMGCPHGVKWDSRRFLDIAVKQGAQVVTGCRVEKVVIENGRASGVLARRGMQTAFYPADLVVIAAGGLGTPVILHNSGIQCASRLFVDPVLTVAAQWRDGMQNQELCMPFVVQQDGYILSPYFDHLSHFFNRDWRFPARHTIGMMIKLADANQGKVTDAGVDKTLSETDHRRLDEAVVVCRDILRRLGAEEDSVFLGTINAGHPGGMLPLTAAEAGTFHHRDLPENLYVADASLFPKSLGNPPIFTIMAMAKRISRICRKRP